jgi:hypothetical protein
VDRHSLPAWRQRRRPCRRRRSRRLCHGARDCRLDRFPCSGVSVGERGRWRATQPGNAIGTGLTHMRRCCSSSKPAAAIAAGVSRAVWHPPNARPKHPVHSPLAERERRPVRQDVLVEAQLTAGAQHASQLGQRTCLVRHGAQDQTSDGGIERHIFDTGGPPPSRLRAPPTGGSNSRVESA